jgi:hypothetical protein
MDAGVGFGLGPMELLLGGCCLILPVIVVFAIVTTKSKRSGRDE